MTILIAHLNAAIAVLAAPDPTSTVPPGGDKVMTLLGYVKWGAGAACVAGLFIAAGAMALSHKRGGGQEHGAAVGWVAGASILCGIAAGLVTALGA